MQPVRRRADEPLFNSLMEQQGAALILDIDFKLREQPSVADEVSIL